MDNALLIRLIAQRLDGDIDESQFNAVRNGLEMACAGENGDDKDLDGLDEVAGLIVQVLDGLARRQTRLERALAAVDPDALPRGDDQAAGELAPPALNRIVEPPTVDPRFSAAPSHGLAA